MRQASCSSAALVCSASSAIRLRVSMAAGRLGGRGWRWLRWRGRFVAECRAIGSCISSRSLRPLLGDAGGQVFDALEAFFGGHGFPLAAGHAPILSWLFAPAGTTGVRRPADPARLVQP